MYPDSWIYRGFRRCNFDLCWKQNGGQDNDLRKIHGFRLLIYAQTALVWNSTTRFCNATSNFDKCHDILCLLAEFAAKHTKAPSQLTTRWKTLAWILAHGSRPIYRAPTYIAVPFHGPHQPRYIGLTLYIKFHEQKLLSTFGMKLLDNNQYIPLLYWTSKQH